MYNKHLLGEKRKKNEFFIELTLTLTHKIRKKYDDENLICVYIRVAYIIAHVYSQIYYIIIDIK